MVDSQETPKPATPPTGRPTEPIRKYRRHQRWMLLIKLLALLLVIVLGLLIYLQTGHAMRHIYLPLASKALGTQIKADTGSLNFTNGRLTLNNLVVDGADGKPAIEIVQTIFQVSLLSLLTDKIPTLDEIRLISPRLNVSIDAKGRSNLDFSKPAGKTPAAAPKDAKGSPQPSKTSKPQLLPELRIGVVEVKDLQLNYNDAQQGMSLDLAPLNLDASNIAPGETGAFDLSLTADVKRPAENLSEKADLSLKGNLTQADTRESLKWDAAMESKISGTVPGLDAPQSLDINAKGKGSYQVTGRVEQQLDLNATTSNGQAGRINAQMTWDKEANQREASLDISDVGKDFLNPIISAFAPVQIAQSTLNGNVKVKGVGETVVFESALSGRDLSFRTGDTPQPTPPLNLSIAYRGSYQPANGMATLEMLNVALDEKGRNLIEVNLDKPVSLALAAPAGSATAAQSPSAVVALKIQTLTMEQVRPWLAIAGVTDTSAVEAATLNGNFKLAIEQMGKLLDLNGQADLVNLRLSAIPAQGLALRHEIALTMQPGKELKVSKATLRLEQNGDNLADMNTSGQMNLASGDANFDVALNVPKVLALSQALQPGEAMANLSGGSLTAHQTIVMDQAKQLISVTGKAGLDGLTLTLAGREPLPLKADADYDVELDKAASRLLIKPLHIQMAQAGKPGDIEIKGDWPTGPAGPYGLPEGEGSLTLSIRDLDAAPWLRLTSALREDALPKSLPIAANNTLTLLKGGTIKSSGELNVGPVDVKDENGLPTELSFKVNNEIEKIGEQLRTLVVDLSSKGSGDTADKVHIEGSGQMGAATNLKLSTRVDQLNLTPYVALAESLTPESEPTKTAPSPQGQTEPAPAPQPENAPTATAATETPAALGEQATPATLVTMDLDVRKLLYKTLAVENLKGNFRKEDQVVSLKLDEGTLNGGPIKADVMSDNGRIEPRFSWDASLEKVPVTPLLESFSPENKDKLSGDLTLTSRGAGEGKGEDLMRRLQSKTDFTIADGKMENYFLLDILAEQTKVESFKKLNFFKFAGSVDVADGQANLKDWRINGTLNQISMNGTVKLTDGEYNINLQAGVGSQLAEKITNTPYTGKLMMTDEGYLRFPLIIDVKGTGDKYRVIPKLDIKGVVGGAVDQLGGAVKGIGGAAEGVGGAVGGILEGIVDRNK